MVDADDEKNGTAKKRKLEEQEDHAGYVVVRGVGVSVDGVAEVVVETAPFETVQDAINRAEYFTTWTRNRGETAGWRDRERNLPRDNGSSSLSLPAGVALGTSFEAPMNTRVWYVARHGNTAPVQGYSNRQYMVMEVKAFIGLTTLQSRQQGVQSIRAVQTVENLQIADGVPYVEAKIFGKRAHDPFILRPNVSKAVFRTLLLRAVGKYLADEREPYPVLPKSDVQLQVAESTDGVQYHVLAIRALGHTAVDFSMAIDDQGRTFVRADPPPQQHPNPKVGRPFELLCQFPSLVQVQTCRCIFQDDVLYIIVYPRTANSRSLRLSSLETTKPVANPESAAKVTAEWNEANAQLDDEGPLQEMENDAERYNEKVGKIPVE